MQKGNHAKSLAQDIKIIYESKDFLVLNKPAGIMVHGDGKSNEYTLADWLIENYPEIENVGESWTDNKGNKIARPGIVHRLDKETSGVLLVAKNQETFLKLKELFMSRKVQKEYRALVYGGFKEDKKEGVIEKKIGRSRNFGKFEVEPFARGTLREALTFYKVLAQTGQDQNKDFAYLALFPKTGRTHQIRVHLKSIHHPIICDKLYAPKKDCALGMSRLALHAHKISFELDGKTFEFEAELPQEFIHALDLVEKLKQ